MAFRQKRRRADQNKAPRQLQNSTTKARALTTSTPSAERTEKEAKREAHAVENKVAKELIAGPEEELTCRRYATNNGSVAIVCNSPSGLKVHYVELVDASGKEVYAIGVGVEHEKVREIIDLWQSEGHEKPEEFKGVVQYYKLGNLDIRVVQLKHVRIINLHCGDSIVYTRVEQRTVGKSGKSPIILLPTCYEMSIEDVIEAITQLLDIVDKEKVKSLIISEVRKAEKIIEDQKERVSEIPQYSSLPPIPNIDLRKELRYATSGEQAEAAEGRALRVDETLGFVAGKDKEFWDEVERIAKEGESKARIKQIAVECAKQELVGRGYKIVHDYVSVPRPFDMVVEKDGKRHLVLVKGKSVDRLDEPILFTKGEITWAEERPNDYIVCIAIVEDERCDVYCGSFPEFVKKWKWQVEDC